ANRGYGRGPGRVQALDIGGDGRRASRAIRGARVAGQQDLGVEALAEARVAAGPGAGLIEDIAGEVETGREVLARVRTVVELEALGVVRHGERARLSDRVVHDGGVERQRIAARRSHLHQETGPVRAPLVHLVV